MTKGLPDNLANVDWSVTTWEGSRREQLRRWSLLPLAEIIAAIEEMETMSSALNPEKSRGCGRSFLASHAGNRGSNPLGVASTYASTAIGA